MAGIHVIAKHLGLSIERIRQLIKAGTITHQPRGGYDVDQCRLEYLRNLRKRPWPRCRYRRGAEAQEDAGGCALRELEYARISGQVVAIADATEFWGQQLAVSAPTPANHRREERGGPGAQPRSPAACQAIVDQAVYDALEELSRESLPLELDPPSAATGPRLTARADSSST